MQVGLSLPDVPLPPSSALQAPGLKAVKEGGWRAAGPVSAQPPVGIQQPRYQQPMPGLPTPAPHTCSQKAIGLSRREWPHTQMMRAPCQQPSMMLHMHMPGMVPAILHLNVWPGAA